MPYDPTLPTDRDKAKALLGDTAATAILADAHYDAVLTLYGFNGGVAFLATELTQQFAQQPDRVTLPSGLSVSWGRRTWASLITAMQNGGIGVSGAFSTTPTRADGYATLAVEEA